MRGGVYMTVTFLHLRHPLFALPLVRQYHRIRASSGLGSHRDRYRAISLPPRTMAPFRRHAFTTLLATFAIT